MLRVLELDQLDPGASPADLLCSLGGPAAVYVPGGPGARRAVVTLLHGDEPSGLRAVHALLRARVMPAGDTLFVVANVAAAHAGVRYLPGERDLNRAFLGPPGDGAARLAADILAALRRFSPACVIDLHNTSGSGPAFGVSVARQPAHDVLTGHFAERLVVTDIRLGAIMEALEPMCPTLTVECGGALDAYADGVARQGLARFLSLADPLAAQPVDVDLDVYVHPVRLEVRPGATLAYAESAQPVDLTLRPDLEGFNFGVAPSGAALGWIKRPCADVLVARTAAGTDVLQRLCERSANGRLYLVQPLRLFMVTGRVEAALTDCLFYAVPVNGGWCD